MLQWLKSTNMLRCKDTKVKIHKGTKVQSCNTALYNGLVPQNSVVLLNSMALLNGVALLYGMVQHLTMAKC